jgi:hypothetical protein
MQAQEEHKQFDSNKLELNHVPIAPNIAPNQELFKDSLSEEQSVEIILKSLPKKKLIELLLKVISKQDSDM